MNLTSSASQLRAYARRQYGTTTSKSVIYNPLTPGYCAYYWSHARDIFPNEAAWNRAAALRQRYARYLETMDARREWVEVRRIAWADNSVERVMRASDGEERTEMVAPPSGDRCF